MPLYEVMFIARQDMSPAQVEQTADKFAQIVKDNAGTVVKCDHWGLKTLAYKINKNRKGHYVLMHLDCPAKALLEFERNMRLSEDILRHLSVKVDAFVSAANSDKPMKREAA